jgi:hypothetical protein
MNELHGLLLNSTSDSKSSSETPRRDPLTAPTRAYLRTWVIELPAPAPCRCPRFPISALLKTSSRIWTTSTSQDPLGESTRESSPGRKTIGGACTLPITHELSPANLHPAERSDLRNQLLRRSFSCPPPEPKGPGVISLDNVDRSPKVKVQPHQRRVLTCVLIKRESPMLRRRGVSTWPKHDELR